MYSQCSLLCIYSGLRDSDYGIDTPNYCSRCGRSSNTDKHIPLSAAELGSTSQFAEVDDHLPCIQGQVGAIDQTQATGNQGLVHESQAMPLHKQHAFWSCILPHPLSYPVPISPSNESRKGNRDWVRGYSMHILAHCACSCAENVN